LPRKAQQILQAQGDSQIQAAFLYAGWRNRTAVHTPMPCVNHHCHRCFRIDGKGRHTGSPAEPQYCGQSRHKAEKQAG
jgi:hypothetical protein